MPGHAANQMRKAVYIAELMHEWGLTVQQAWNASDRDKKLLSAGAAERMGLKTGRAEINPDGSLNISKVRKPSDETWGYAVTELQHKIDQDAAKQADPEGYAKALFESVR